MFNISSKKLDNNCNIREILDNFFEFREILENENDSQLKDYRDINQDEKSNYFKHKFSKLPIHDKSKNLNLDNVMMDFDATILHLSAMWDENSLYPEIETRVALKPDMNDVYVEAFNDHSFNRDGNESAILKIKHYNPPDIVFLHLPVKEEVKT